MKSSITITTFIIVSMISFALSVTSGCAKLVVKLKITTSLKYMVLTTKIIIIFLWLFKFDRR